MGIEGSDKSGATEPSPIMDELNKLQAQFASMASDEEKKMQQSLVGKTAEEIATMDL